MLLKSGCHFYFTRPFVPSWSLLESLACGCFVVATDHKCVTEITGALGDSAALLVDHRNPLKAARTVKDHLCDLSYVSKKRKWQETGLRFLTVKGQFLNWFRSLSLFSFPALDC